MVVVGLILVLLDMFVIRALESLKTKKSSKILLNILLLGVSFVYLLCSIVLKVEPFDYEYENIEDYFVNVTVIFIFSPFLWGVLGYYCWKVFKRIRVKKNAKVKSDSQYIYYRDDLNKISPSIIMFTSIMDTDVKKSVSSTILKLKLTGYIEEANDSLKCTSKDTSILLESEKIILDSIKYKIFDEKSYKNCVKKEALEYGYIKKNKAGKFLRLIKMLIIICIPVILIMSSMKFDNFVMEDYEIYVLDNIRYIKIDDKKAIEYLEKNVVKNKDDYYHSYGEVNGVGDIFYSYNLIRADKYEYGIVREKLILDILVSLSILVSITSVFICFFKLIEQIIYFNKNYIRTAKGNELLNKAYALKNYLKDYSLIKDRTEEELVLWEYYLVYAVILDVNVKIKNDIIEKYMQSVILRSDIKFSQI